MHKRLLHAAQTVLTKPVTLQGTEIVESDTVNAEVEDFKLFGRSTQDGIPTPDNPVEIVSVGTYNESTGKYEIEINVTGKNLYSGLDVIGIQNFYVELKNIIQAGIYTISADVESEDTYSELCIFILYDENKKIIGSPLIKRGKRVSKTIVANKEFKGITFYASKSNLESVGDSFSFRNIQIESCETATSYEPYRNPQTVILELNESLRSLPDGTRDKVYIDKVNGKAWVERCVGVKVLDGSEVFVNKDNVGWQCFVNNIGRLISSHFEETMIQKKNSNKIRRAALSSFVFYPDFYDKGMDYWKEWLANQYNAGTPVTVQYQRAEPKIEELSPETTAQLLSLHSNYPTTIITNTEGADMEVTLKSLKIIGGGINS